jgi:transposase
VKNNVVVGLDVSKDFSCLCMVGPDGKKLGKPFKVLHTLEGLNLALKRLKEVEYQYGSKCILVMEATGFYSRLLFHFFHQSNLDVWMVNPIQSNSIKNIKVRKVKNDKVDAYRIALLFLLGEAVPVRPPREDLAEINILCRQYFRLSDDFTKYKNHLVSLVCQVFPNYDKVFSDITSESSLYILENFSSPNKLLKADKETLVQTIAKLSRKGRNWALEKYDALIDVAREALILGCAPPAAETAILADIAVLRALNEQMRVVENKIRDLSSNVREIKLVSSIPGFGILSAAAFVSEIRDFCSFKSPKKLTAFCGIDPAVLQSGKFKVSQVKISKRGSVFLRRVLYTAALASIRKKRNGDYFNPVLVDYYECKIQSKPKNVALVAVMHKLVRYIFAVLRDEKPFRLITPEEHLKAFEEARLSPLKMSA